MRTQKKSFKTKFVALLALAALLPPGGLAQNPQQPIDPRLAPSPPPPQIQRPLATDRNDKNTIRSAVDLVEVDVEVTDRDGKPVKGLRQDQFTVTEDSKEQKISTFDFNDVEKIEKAEATDSTPVTISIGGATPPEQIRQVVRDRRLMLLFFDLTSLQSPDLVRSTAAAKKFIKEQMTSADLVGVVAFGNQLKIVTDFTTDRDKLDQAVDALLPGKEAALAALADAAAVGNEDAVTEDTDAAFTADNTEFNVFNTDRKLSALESLLRSAQRYPGQEVRDRIHQRHHPDG